MPRETVHIVQAHTAGKGRGLKTELPVGCTDAAEAARKAERLAPAREGVIAYSVSADVEMGDYNENPTVLFEAGASHRLGTGPEPCRGGGAKQCSSHYVWHAPGADVGSAPGALKGS